MKRITVDRKYIINYMNKTRIKKIILSFATIIAVAVICSVFVSRGMDWYGALQKPSQWIPNIVIPIMWTVIYIAFAVINFLWISNGDIPKFTVVMMAINAVLNVLWCLVFFTLKQMLIGNVVIIFNLIASFAVVGSVAKHKPIYACILSIYPMWLAIATTLNTALWILN